MLENMNLFGPSSNSPKENRPNISDDALAMLHQVDKEIFIQGQRLSVMVAETTMIFDDTKIDLPQQVLRSIFTRTKVQLLPIGFFHPHPEFRSRLLPVAESFNSMQVTAVDPHDIFLLKLDSNRAKDRTDMFYMLKTGVVSTRKLDPLFKGWNEHWYNGNAEISSVYERIKKDYMTHSK